MCAGRALPHVGLSSQSIEANLRNSVLGGTLGQETQLLPCGQPTRSRAQLGYAELIEHPLPRRCPLYDL